MSDSQRYDAQARLAGDLRLDLVRTPDTVLRSMLGGLRARAVAGESLDALLPETFAVVGEASVRAGADGPEHVGFMAGAALHDGVVADVKDGEGKDLIILLAAVLNALAGRGAHIAMVDEAAARLRADRARPVCALLGLDVGWLAPDMRADQRKAYAADLTYGSAETFVFDYMKDSLHWKASLVVQRGHNFAVVDEADLVLIDRSRVNVVSGPGKTMTNRHLDCARAATRMRQRRHYTITSSTTHTVSLTDKGVRIAERVLNVGDLYADAELLDQLRTALIAKDRLVRGTHYEVRDNRIVLLDHATQAPVTRYGSGTPALEAKEGLPISTPLTTLTRITTGSYYRRYTKLAGMSCSASRAATELTELYGLDTVEIPTHGPVQRLDQDDVIFSTDPARDDAAAAAVLQHHDIGRAVVVGTATAENAKRFSRLLSDAGVLHRVVDALDPEQTAAAMQTADTPGTVTILVSPSGRGHQLGKQPRPAQRIQDLDPRTRGTGQLAVIGLDRHQSRRHDDWLRGLAGQTGRSDWATFYLSLDGPTFDGGGVSLALAPPFRDTDPPWTDPRLTDLVQRVQERGEADLLDWRKQVNDYALIEDGQIEAHREVFRRVRQADDLTEDYESLMFDLVTDLMNEHCPPEIDRSGWKLGEIAEYLNELRSGTVGLEELTAPASDRDQLASFIHARVKTVHRERCLELQHDQVAVVLKDQSFFGYDPALDTPSWRIACIQRAILLGALDSRFRNHLTALERLKVDIDAMSASPDEKIAEFKREAFSLFQVTQKKIRELAIYHFFTMN